MFLDYSIYVIDDKNYILNDIQKIGTRLFLYHPFNALNLLKQLT